MKNTVYKNASIVTGLSVAERALGFLYRILLSRLIGAEGVGLYQIALSLFSLVLTLSTGGIPITVSRMISKSKAENNPQAEKATLSAGLLVSLLCALPCCLLLWLFGEKLPFLFSDIRSLRVLKILLVGLCFSCLYAVIRGHLWGNKRFLPASLLEMLEETVMVMAGLLLLRGIATPLDGAEKAAWAVVLSYLFSAFAALLYFFLSGGRLANPKNTLKPLFNAAMPITSVRASASLVNSAVAVLLPAMLMKAGVDEREALKLFGVVSGMVIPVLFIPSTLIGSLALVLVPELSEDFYKNNTQRLKKNILRGLRFAFLIACALIPFFFVLGERVGSLAFSDLTAGEMIAKSCPILLPMSLTMISTSILNSIGYEKQTFIFFFCGAAALLLSILLLPPLCGVYAYVIGLGASYAVTALCNLIFLGKKCPFLFKGAGQVWIYFFFSSLILILPISIIGQFSLHIFQRCFGDMLSIVCTGIVMSASTLLCYFLLTRSQP